MSLFYLQAVSVGPRPQEAAIWAGSRESWILETSEEGAYVAFQQITEGQKVLRDPDKLIPDWTLGACNKPPQWGRRTCLNCLIIDFRQWRFSDQRLVCDLWRPREFGCGGTLGCISDIFKIQRLSQSCWSPDLVVYSPGEVVFHHDLNAFRIIWLLVLERNSPERFMTRTRLGHRWLALIIF